LEAWIEFEESVKNAAKKENIQVERPAGLEGKTFNIDTFTLIESLYLANKISEEDVRRYKKLKSIRNKAVHAHDFEISQENAETFLRLMAMDPIVQTE